MQFDMTNSLSGMLQKHFNHDNIIIIETFYVFMYRWNKRQTYHPLTTDNTLSVITGLGGKGVIEGIKTTRKVKHFNVHYVHIQSNYGLTFPRFIRFSFPNEQPSPNHDMDI